MTASVRSTNVRPAPYHAALVVAFIEHRKVVDVARAVGLSSRTVRRWKAAPGHWAEVLAAREEVLQRALAIVAAERAAQIAAGRTS